MTVSVFLSAIALYCVASGWYPEAVTALALSAIALGMALHWPLAEGAE